MNFVDVVQFIASHLDEILVAIVAIFVAVIALMHAIIGISLLIPGPQPETFLQSGVDKLQSIVDFLTKFSRK
jgi:succinate dehydrogenase/fumarate reductase cytochrome b subunit